MKKHGIINAPLSGALARLAHTDLVVVADAGLPVPPGVPVVDLAIVYGEPRFTVVLDALLAEIVVEHAIISADADATPAAGWITERLDVTIDRVAHSHFKELVGTARLAVRTGEDTPFANVILRCGVPFA